MTRGNIYPSENIFQPLGLPFLAKNSQNCLSVFIDTPHQLLTVFISKIINPKKPESNL